jgi:hypothetical protein
MRLIAALFNGMPSTPNTNIAAVCVKLWKGYGNDQFTSLESTKTL